MGFCIWVKYFMFIGLENPKLTADSFFIFLFLKETRMLVSIAIARKQRHSLT